MSKSAFESPNSKIHYVAWDKPEEILLHAIHMLENVGDVTYLPRLKELANHTILGKPAVETLRKLEGIIN